MADPTTDDVTSLANLLPLGYGPRDQDTNVFQAAERILASSWLAERDARIRAEALREAAGEGDCARTAKVCFCGSADWLRARAEAGGE